MPQRMNHNADDADRFLELHSNQTGADDQLSDQQRLLEKVLEETLAAASTVDAIQVIRTVAGRTATSDITDILVAEELVREILQKRLKNWQLPSFLPRQVAEILLDDPHARSRLIRLWAEAKQP